MSFQSDFDNALHYEHLTLAMLKVHGFDAQPGPEFAPGTHPPDIILKQDDSQRSIDVKHDVMSVRTGNIFIEEKSLYADYLCYYADYDGTIMFLKVADLKRWLATKPAKVRYTGCAGDAKKWNGKHGGWIVPISLVKDNAWWLVDDPDWTDRYRDLYCAGY